MRYFSTAPLLGFWGSLKYSSVSEAARTPRFDFPSCRFDNFRGLILTQSLGVIHTSPFLSFTAFRVFFLSTPIIIRNGNTSSHDLSNIGKTGILDLQSLEHQQIDNLLPVILPL
jgi:hypothetical protein